MSEVLEPNNVNQLEGGHAGKLATLASEEVLASRYHRTQLWPICNNPVLDAQMTARGFQGTQRSAHKMPNSVSILLRNQCDFCFSNANAGRWPAVLVFTKTKYAVGLFYASEHHTSLLGLQPSFLGAEGLRGRPHEGPMLRGRTIEDFFVPTMGTRTRPATWWCILYVCYYPVPVLLSYTTLASHILN